MKAAIFSAIGDPLSIRDVETTPLRYGQVRVKIEASGICGAQIQELDGHKTASLPRMMGHEGVGTVLETGPLVSTMQKGDRCVLHWRKGSGIESEFPVYTMNGKEFTSGRVTTFAEEVVVSENRVTKVPQDAPTKLCTLLGCSLSTALGTIEQEANLKMGERVLIIGCGGLGINLIRVAKMRHASWVVCVDHVASKEPAAKLAGADSFSSTFHDQIPQFDVVIDTTGSPQAISNGVSLLADSGRFILVGHPPPHGDVLLTNADHLFGGTGKTIKATQGGGFRPDIDIPRYYALWQSGALDVTGIVSHEIYLKDINEGIRLVREGHAGRVMIKP